MRHLLLLVVTAVLVGCTAPEAQPTMDASIVPPSASEPPASSAPSPHAEAGGAPPELAGTWRRSYQGDPMLLTLDGTGYTVRTPLDMGAGSILVDGDRITFSNSTPCPDGVGTYLWSIEEDGRLRLTPVGEDPCGRADFLPRVTWGRVDD